MWTGKLAVAGLSLRLFLTHVVRQAPRGARAPSVRPIRPTQVLTRVKSSGREQRYRHRQSMRRRQQALQTAFDGRKNRVEVEESCARFNDPLGWSWKVF